MNAMKLVIPAVMSLLVICPPEIFAQADVGKTAPEFTLPGIGGKPVKLSDFKGRFIVLEWTNPDCPFVKKHYSSGNMQRLQKKYTEKDVVWLSIASSAEGKQGSYNPQKWGELVKERNIASTDVLLDPQGEIGKIYGAKTTPHMFVINPEGNIIYAGAIDDKPTFDAKDVPTAKNYVEAALEQAMSGKPVDTASVQPYGCSVKY